MDIRSLKGVGDKTAALFEKLHIFTAEELVRYYPRDYEQFSEPVALASAQPEELVTVEGRLLGNVATRHVRGLSITGFQVSCAGGGTLSLTYFNMPYLKNSLKRGVPYFFRGRLHRGKERFFMEQAKIYKPEEYGKLMDALQPRYAVTKGLTNNAVTKAVRQAIGLVAFAEDALPEEICKKERFMGLSEAVAQMHFPTNRETLTEARRRLVFEEFFQFILAVRRMKEAGEREKNAHPMLEVAQTKRLIEALPYRLTGAQERVWREIQDDLCGESVMNRLIQGDVGSGKTILAFLSLIMCVANGCQGAMMAPTEVLARQHYESLCALKKKYGLEIHPVLLTGSVTGKSRREIYEAIESGEADIILGTHALIQEKVAYRNLALVVTDEQHRFGVRQRESLMEKGSAVHVLVMSATPIPRTLAIILYGDLHISVLDELPADRLAIKNCVVNTNYRNTAYHFIEKEVASGSQAYVICPMVEEGESQELEDVGTYTQKLRGALPPSVRVAALHGRMRSAEKNRIMEAFEAHDIDVLVSTTVIEVGINVPNATVMLIENAERFGLAQLHQLRGRVGRGDKQSYCIFISASEKLETMERLKILNESNDGFVIAGKDLALRGPGDLFGIRQSGEMQFALGDIYQDAAILQSASDWADRILLEDPELMQKEHEGLKRSLEGKLAAGGNEVDFRSI
ncbi:MAG: ATP-dependent DNA helicase RecG [Bacteroidales bacterium]|nr:ATP-dependent DNA helicase RecG [Bacteroidales bacterium]MCM1414429.1 ATP-dependent DNA helicase RecG [bacterium]MCM1422308.1 ATP-dependent DNA helicase RecG [bacterium]